MDQTFRLYPEHEISTLAPYRLSIEDLEAALSTRSRLVLDKKMLERAYSSAEITTESARKVVAHLCMAIFARLEWKPRVVGNLIEDDVLVQTDDSEHELTITARWDPPLDAVHFDDPKHPGTAETPGRLNARYDRVVLRTSDWVMTPEKYGQLCREWKPAGYDLYRRKIVFRPDRYTWLSEQDLIPTTEMGH